MHLTVTGHRPDRLGGYGEGARIRLEAFANKMLMDLSPACVRIGGALGWDQACGWAAFRRGIPFEIIEPGMPPSAAGPTAFGSRWPLLARERYERLCSYAASVTRLPWPGAGREYSARDRHLLDEPCDMVAALWCGEPSGTGTTVRMAGERGRPVWNFWEEWQTWVN